MVDFKDILSLTEFQRTTRDAIARLKKTGRPAVLTVNGRAEIVVQDAMSYQRLRAYEADKLLELRRSLAEYRTGRLRAVENAIGDLEAKHLRVSKPRVRRKVPVT